MNYIPLTLRALIICFLLLSCTESGDVYNKNKHTKKDFSAEKTVGAILLGAAAVAAVAAGSGRGYRPAVLGSETPVTASLEVDGKGG